MSRLGTQDEPPSLSFSTRIYWLSMTGLQVGSSIRYEMKTRCVFIRGVRKKTDRATDGNFCCLRENYWVLIKTYCKRGGNELIRANVSLRSPYVGPPLKVSVEFFL